MKTEMGDAVQVRAFGQDTVLLDVYDNDTGYILSFELDPEEAKQLRKNIRRALEELA